MFGLVSWAALTLMITLGPNRPVTAHRLSQGPRGYRAHTAVEQGKGQGGLEASFQA